MSKPVKFNVSKLIQLRTEEKAIVAQFSTSLYDFQRAELQDRIQIIRQDFETESEKLRQMIAEAEGGRVSARKIDVKDIIDDLIAVNEYLGITKKSLKGTTVHVDHHAQTFPGAYKGTPESTHFDAVFTTGWIITAIYRDTCVKQKYSLKLSETAKAEYLQNAESLK